MKLLKQLYHIDSQSRREQKMIVFIAGWLKENHIPFTLDKVGNILATKGESETYPCVCAHMDEVQDPRPEDFSVKRDTGVIYGFSPSKLGQCGLGADDKNGLWIALNLLRRLPVLKVAFFVGEEIGCYGSERVDLSFFNNVRFVIQCDRKNGSDFINKASSVKLCEDSFMNAVGMEKFGYKPCTGMLTDVVTLRERGLAVSCCNLSCGYYFPHTEKEVTRWPELENCLAFVEHICTTVTEVQPASVESRYSSYYYPYYHNGFTLSFFEDDELDTEVGNGGITVRNSSDTPGNCRSIQS